MFSQLMDQTLCATENGSILYTKEGMVGGVNTTQLQGQLILLFNGTVRGCSPNQLQQLILNVQEAIQPSNQLDTIQNLFIMSFQLRSIRESGGKGERDLSRWMWIVLYSLYPEYLISLLDLIPHYGYWKDLIKLIEDLNDKELLEQLGFNGSNQPLLDAIYQQFQEQLISDKRTLESNQKQLSLLAKWFPKEGRSHDKKYKTGKRIAQRVFPKEFQRDPTWGRKCLRQLISNLNQAIHTTETLMHDNKFHLIQFQLVPGKCLQLKRRSFLNLVGGSKSKSNEPRCQEKDRVKCAENLEKHIQEVSIGKVKLQGKTLQPHEIVKSIHENRIKSPLEKKLVNVQWKAILDSYLELAEKEGSIGLDKVMPLVDVSGSMLGIPILVSVALGIMFSQLAKGPFHNRFLAFSETPEWTLFKEEWDIIQRVRHAFGCNGHGLSTDYLACHELILDIAEKHKLQPQDLPEIFLVLSDMQFNSAMKSTGSNKYPIISKYIQPSLLHNINTITDHINTITDHRPQHEILTQAYHDHGIKVCGKPFILPRTIYWNLRGDTQGCAVQADTPNTQLASGFSPNMLVPILSNTFEQKERQPAKEITPWETLQEILHHQDYHQIRERIV